MKIKNSRLMKPINLRFLKPLFVFSTLMTSLLLSSCKNDSGSNNGSRHDQPIIQPHDDCDRANLIFEIGNKVKIKYDQYQVETYSLNERLLLDSALLVEAILESQQDLNPWNKFENTEQFLNFYKEFFMQNGALNSTYLTKHKTCRN